MSELKKGIKGFLNKKYKENSYILTAKSGKEYGAFTVVEQDKEKNKTYYNCIAFDKNVLDDLEKHGNDTCIVTISEYDVKTSTYNDKEYITYTVFDFREIKVLQSKQTIVTETLPTINPDQLNMQMPF